MSEEGEGEEREGTCACGWEFAFRGEKNIFSVIGVDSCGTCVEIN